jgi:transposase InsO family protein
MNRRKLIKKLELLFKQSQEAVISYLTAEIRFLMNHLSKRPKPTEAEKAMLARAAKAVDPLYLEKTFNLFTPATLYRWYREMIRRKSDYSYLNKKPGRPRINRELENWIVKLAIENPTVGYESLVGKLKILGFETNNETIQNVLKRNGILPSPGRQDNLTWPQFLELHKDYLVATDFFTWEVLTEHGLITYYALFFIRHKTREVHIAGITQHPNEAWMCQVARNLTDPERGFLKEKDILIHDRDTKYMAHFCQILNQSGIQTKKIPPKSPNLNAYAERFVRTVKEQCLSRLIITSEERLREALKEFLEYYHYERCHQGIGNLIPFPRKEDNIGSKKGQIKRLSRLGRLLNYYHRSKNADPVMVSA